MWLTCPAFLWPQSSPSYLFRYGTWRRNDGLDFGNSPGGGAASHKEVQTQLCPVPHRSWTCNLWQSVCEPSFLSPLKEYIHRVGRTARGLNGRGHALLILRPEELGFLRYLKQSKVKTFAWIILSWERIPLGVGIIGQCRWPEALFL